LLQTALAFVNRRKNETPFIIQYILLLLFSLFFALVLAFEWRTIEKDVAANATASLESKDIQWAKITTRDFGRTAVIQGTAASKSEADQTINLVEESWGVHKVEFDYDTQVVIIPDSPPSLNAIVTQGSIVLRGKIKDQETINRLLKQASDVFGKDNVVNKLEVTKNTAALENYPGFFKSLQGRGNTAPFSAAIANDSLTLSGQVVDANAKRGIGENMAKLTQLPIDNRIKVVLPAPVEVVVAEPEPVKEDICLSSVQAILNNGKINFATGKAIINQDSFELLNNIADIAKTCPDASFIIGGHTDSTGRLESNNLLSEQRAQSVVNHLVGLGLTKERFKAVGYGPSNPIADNNTREGRAQNRRIEFKLPTKQNSTN